MERGRDYQDHHRALLWDSGAHMNGAGMVCALSHSLPAARQDR